METDFTISRKASKWIQKISKEVECKQDIVDVINAKYPLGILPTNIFTEEELRQIQLQLNYIPSNNYDNTDETEKVVVWGRPFVDSKTINEHLQQNTCAQFYTLVSPVFRKIIAYLESFGFNVAPLIDSSTLLPYGYMVARKISVPEDCKTRKGGDCTVIHFDDWSRDAMLKSDFSEGRFPIGITPNNYSQVSLCIPLCNGLFRPDYLEVYNYRYFPKDRHELVNWRVLDGRKEFLKNVPTHRHLPINGQPYFFNTQNCHDVLGGDSRSTRINLSVFFLYVEETNTLYPYN